MAPIVCKDTEKLDLWQIACQSVKWFINTGKQFYNFFENLNMHLPHNPGIELLGIHHPKMKIYVHIALFWTSQVALVVKNLPPNAGDTRDVGLIPGLGRSSGGGPGNPIQYSCLGNPMDRGAQWATIRSVAKSQTSLRQLIMHAQFYFQQSKTGNNLNIPQWVSG